MPVEKVYGQLVRGHHHRRVGDLPDEVGGEAPVQPRPALLPVHQHQRLPERPVLRPALPQPRPDDLCKAGLTVGLDTGSPWG